MKKSGNQTIFSCLSADCDQENKRKIAKSETFSNEIEKFTMLCYSLVTLN